MDPWFIVSAAPEEAKIIRAAREVNDQKPEWVIEKVKAAIGEYLMENPTKTASQVCVACYGLAFKPDIDDLRESPSLSIAKQLINEHAGQLIVVEPNINKMPKSLEKATLLSQSEAKIADIHVMLVDHKPFKNSPTPDGKIVDARGVWSKRNK